MRKFENLTIKDRESVKDFSSRAIEVINQIKSYGDDVSNKNTRCKNPSYLESNCWYKDKGEGSGEKNATNFLKNDDQLIYSCMNIKHKGEKVCYLDNGYSHHITGDLTSFEKLDKTYSSFIKLGDNKKVKIKRRGGIAIFTNRGNEKHICDVFYSSNFGKNLLSVGKMVRKGYMLIFVIDKCEIYNKKTNQRIIAIKMISINMFPLNMKSLHNTALRSEHADESYLWQLRYRHLNFNGLQLLKQKNMVVGLPLVHNKIGVYEGKCIIFHFQK